MYLRHSTKRTKDGDQTYWTLVRSVRRGAKVVQETVANLGRLDAAKLREAVAISRHFLGARADQLELFEERTELTPQTVHTGRVRLERGRAFGDVWLGWTLWRALELDAFCEKHIPDGRECVWCNETPSLTPDLLK